MKKRALIARSGLVAALIALSVYLYIVGMGHTVYLDTNSVGEGDGRLRAPEYSAVYVDRAKEPEEMGRAERVIATVMGAKHTVRVESLDGDEKKYERSIRIPVSWSEVVVSIPAIVAGAPDELVLQRFTAPEISEEDAEVERTVMQEEATIAAPPAP